jgi:hypothetical protein
MAKLRESMVVRHEKLKARPRCRIEWPSRDVDHVHSCEVFVGHVGHHSCACGGSKLSDLSGRPRLGARA